MAEKLARMSELRLPHLEPTVFDPEELPWRLGSNPLRQEESRIGPQAPVMPWIQEVLREHPR